jgi:protein-arginine kinase
MVFTAHTFLLGNVVELNISIAFDPKFGYLSSSPPSIMDSSKDLESLHTSGYN